MSNSGSDKSYNGNTGERRQKKSLPDIYREMAPFFNFAYSLLAAVLLSYFVGGWIDNKFGTGPWGMLGLLMLTIVASFYSFLTAALKSSQKGAKK